MRLLVISVHSAHGVRTDAATRRSDGASRDLAEILLAASVAFVTAIAVATVVIVVVKIVQAVILIREGRARLRTTVLRSTESACVSGVIKLSIPTSLVVIAPSFLGVEALIPKERNSIDYD